MGLHISADTEHHFFGVYTETLCTANIRVGVVFTLQVGRYYIVPGLCNPRLLNKSFNNAGVASDVFHFLLLWICRLLFFFALSQHLKFPFYVVNLRYIRSLLLVSVVLLLPQCPNNVAFISPLLPTV